MNDDAHGPIADVPGDTLLACYARLSIWVPWFYKPKKSGGFAKVPFIAPGEAPLPKLACKAATTLDLATCLADRSHNQHKSGLGLLLGRVLPHGETLLALDFDAARDANTGEIQAWAIAMLAPFAGMFMQLSPSRTGVHVLMRLSPPEALRIRALVDQREQVPWKRGAIAGGKQPGLDLLIGNFITFTGELLPNSPRSILRAPIDALEDLILRVAPAFAETSRVTRPASPNLTQDLEGGAVAPKAAAGHSDADRGIPGPDRLPAIAEQTGPRFIASATRMARWAVEFDDEQFQLIAALGAYSRKVRNGRAPVWLAHARMLQLPAASPGTHRSASMIRKTLVLLTLPAPEDGPPHPWGHEPFLVPISRDAFLEAVEVNRRHNFDWRIHPYAMIPWRLPPPPGRDQPKSVRMPLGAWRKAVWNLTPLTLRLFAYLLATHVIEDRDPTIAFRLEASRLAKILKCKRDRITSAAAEIAVAGLLEVVTPSCAATRCPATFRWPAGGGEKQ